MILVNSRPKELRICPESVRLLPELVVHLLGDALVLCKKSMETTGSFQRRPFIGMLLFDCGLSMELKFSY